MTMESLGAPTAMARQETQEAKAGPPPRPWSQPPPPGSGVRSGVRRGAENSGGRAVSRNSGAGAGRLAILTAGGLAPASDGSGLALAANGGLDFLADCG